MNISSYSDLLTAAKSQAESQRLLFAFARAELPPGAGSAEQQSFTENQGGTLSPIMCVDKLADELSSFKNLVEESQKTGEHWDIVFVTTMSGRNGQEPSHNDAEAPLKMMIAAIENGQIANFLAFNRAGELVQFH